MSKVKNWFARRRGSTVSGDSSNSMESFSSSPTIISRDDIYEKVVRFVSTENEDIRYVLVDDILNLQKKKKDLRNLYSSYVKDNNFISFMNSLGGYFIDWLVFLRKNYENNDIIDKSSAYCVSRLLNDICNADANYSVILCNTNLINETNQNLMILDDKSSEKVLFKIYLIDKVFYINCN